MFNLQLAFGGHTFEIFYRSPDLLVPLKPICETLGLSWESERERVTTDDFLSECVSILQVEMPSGSYAALCLPIELLAGYLFSIDLDSVKNPRDLQTLTNFKRQCMAALPPVPPDLLASLLGRGPQ